MAVSKLVTLLWMSRVRYDLNRRWTEEEGIERKTKNNNIKRRKKNEDNNKNGIHRQKKEEDSKD